MFAARRHGVNDAEAAPSLSASQELAPDRPACITRRAGSPFPGSDHQIAGRLQHCLGSSDLAVLKGAQLAHRLTAMTPTSQSLIAPGSSLLWSKTGSTMELFDLALLAAGRYPFTSASPSSRSSGCLSVPGPSQ